MSLVKKRQVLRLTEQRTLVPIEEEAPKPPADHTKERFYAMISLASELGFSISLPIVIGAIVGQLLDSRFGTQPRLTLSLLFGGLFIGAMNIYLIIKENGD